MILLKENHLLVFFLLSSFIVALGQSGSSSIEPAVDDAQYERILEYYSYDEGHYLDPEKYNKEILEWLKDKL